MKAGPMRQAMTHKWDGVPDCGKRHRWGGELLHTFVATGHVVTTRTCTFCGATRVTRTLVSPRRG